VRIEPQCRTHTQIREHERYLRNKPVKIDRGTLGVRLLSPSSSLERVRQNLALELVFAKNGSKRDRDKYTNIIQSRIRARFDAEFADLTENEDKTLVTDVNRVFADMEEKLEWTEYAVRAMVTHNDSQDKISAAIAAACEAAPRAVNAGSLFVLAHVFLPRDAAPRLSIAEILSTSKTADDDAAVADDEDEESDDNDDDDESHSDAKNKSAVAASKGEKTAIADDNEEEDEESSEINVKKVRKYKKSKDSDGNEIDNEHDDGDENEETVDVRYQSTSSKRRRG
jgi:hypothetical protein